MRALSFDTLRTDLKGVAKTLCLAFALLAALDTAMWAWDPFGLRSGWDIPWVKAKIEGARRTCREKGRIDVMLLGSSIGLNIDVGLWEEACGGRRVFWNASVGSQQPDFARQLFERVYYPETRPTHVIYVVSIPALSGPVGDSPLYNSVMGRRFAARTLRERAVALLERVSYLFRCRQHVRRLIVWGRQPDETPFLHDDHGSNFPTVRRLTPDEVASGKYRGTFHFESPFRALDEGRFGELVRLGNFCRDHGVEFVIASQPMSPNAATFLKSPATEIADYKAALQRLRSLGFRVIDMDKAVPVTDRDFSDPVHPNRWGGFRMTDNLYQEVIRPWFPGDALVKRLPESAEAAAYSLAPATETRFYAQNRLLVQQTAELAKSLQIVAPVAGGRIPVDCPIPPGRYLMEVYGTDERTSPTDSEPGHLLSLELTPEGGARHEQKIAMSRKDVLGATVTRVPVDLAATATLALRVDKVDGPECVLDSLFLRRRCGPDTDSLPPCEEVLRSIRLPMPIIVSNGSFEYEDVRNPGWPAEWKPYSPDGNLWGEYGLSTDAREGRRSMRVQLVPAPGRPGAAMAYSIPPPALPFLLGKAFIVRVWVKSETRAAFGGISVLKGGWTESRLPPYTTVNRWQQLEMSAAVPPDATAVSVLLGAQTATPVLFDGLSYEIVVGDAATTGGPR
jgi:hypothetical protein